MLSLVRALDLTGSGLKVLTFFIELEPDSGRDEIEIVGDFEIGGNRV